MKKIVNVSVKQLSVLSSGYRMGRGWGTVSKVPRRTMFRAVAIFQPLSVNSGE